MLDHVKRGNKLFLQIVSPNIYKQHTLGQKVASSGRAGWGRKGKKELRCVMYRFQFPAVTIIITYCKHVLIEIKATKVSFPQSTCKDCPLPWFGYGLSVCCKSSYAESLVPSMVDLVKITG